MDLDAKLPPKRPLPKIPKAEPEPRDSPRHRDASGASPARKGRSRSPGGRAGRRHSSSKLLAAPPPGGVLVLPPAPLVGGVAASPVPAHHHPLEKSGSPRPHGRKGERATDECAKCGAVLDAMACFCAKCGEPTGRGGDKARSPRRGPPSASPSPSPSPGRRHKRRLSDKGRIRSPSPRAGATVRSMAPCIAGATKPVTIIEMTPLPTDLHVVPSVPPGIVSPRADRRMTLRGGADPLLPDRPRDVDRGSGLGGGYRFGHMLSRRGSLSGGGHTLPRHYVTTVGPSAYIKSHVGRTPSAERLRRERLAAKEERRKEKERLREIREEERRHAEKLREMERIMAIREARDRAREAHVDPTCAEPVKRKCPCFTYTMLFILTVCMIAEFFVNGYICRKEREDLDSKDNVEIEENCAFRYDFSEKVNFCAVSLRLNFMFGPSKHTLDVMGAKVTEKVQEGQIWRLFTAMFLHGGVLHFGLNSYSLWDVGVKLEQRHGVLKVSLIYFVSGLLGFCYASVFAPLTMSVGASGAIFGLMGAYLGDVIQNWHLFDAPCWELLGVLIGSVIQLMMGTTPMIDNFSHFFGFFTGVFLALAFMVLNLDSASISWPWLVSCRRTIFQGIGIVGASLMVVLAAGCMKGGWNPMETAPWIQFIDCVPFPWGCEDADCYWDCSQCSAGGLTASKKCKIEGEPAKECTEDEYCVSNFGALWSCRPTSQDANADGTVKESKEEKEQKRKKKCREGEGNCKCQKRKVKDGETEPKTEVKKKGDQICTVTLQCPAKNPSNPSEKGESKEITDVRLPPDRSLTDQQMVKMCKTHCDLFDFNHFLEQLAGSGAK